MKNLTQYLAFLIVVGTSVFPLAVSSALAGPDCTCKYKDQNIPEGQSTCIKTPNGSVIATCSRVLNNTSWKFTKNACPLS